MDVEQVLAAAREAVARGRTGGGPTFLECLTYRFEFHHSVERFFRPSYRTEEEIGRWRARDPLIVQGSRLTPAVRESIDAEVESTLAKAVSFALSSPHPEPADALDHLYATGLRPRAGVA